jgi:hypothetical protein
MSVVSRKAAGATTTTIATTEKQHNVSSRRPDMVGMNTTNRHSIDNALKIYNTPKELIIQSLTYY